jgi:hypothetical protein
VADTMWLPDVNGEPDEFEVYTDGMGRRRFRTGRGIRRGRRAARRAARRASRNGWGPGRYEAAARTFVLPDGSRVCPGPTDMITLSDEGFYDSIDITDLSTWPNPAPFFTTRSRETNGVAVTNLLDATKANYDVDIESIGVAFHALDSHVALSNADVQTLAEIIARGVLEYNIQSKFNVVYPVADCPAGSGTWHDVFTTENNMRTLAIQNGDPSKGRRKLTALLPMRKNTSFSDRIHLSAADAVLVAALANDPANRPFQVKVHMYGPEGVPLVPGTAGALLRPQGLLAARG